MITMIAATSIEGIIGVRGSHSLLWKSKVDLDLFKEATMGQTLVVGHNTFKSLKGKELKGRKLVVLSKDEKPRQENNVTFTNSVSDIIKNYESFVVIGGESLYNLFMPVTDEVLLSTLNLTVEGDEDYAYFPIEAMEKDFYLSTQSDTIPDEDKRSNQPISLIVSRWHRKINEVH